MSRLASAPISSTVLAVETSNNRTTVALRCGDELRYHAVCPVRDNLGWLRVQVGDALRAAGLDSLAALDALAVAHGPGGLTGVRVGVGFVQALSLASGCPVVGVNSLSAMAWSTWQRVAGDAALTLGDGQGRLSVALDARMQQLYLAEWSWPLADAGMALTTAADRIVGHDHACQGLAPTIIAGPGWDLCRARLRQALWIPDIAPDAAAVAALAQMMTPQPARALQVHYLRGVGDVAQIPERLQTPPPGDAAR